MDVHTLEALSDNYMYLIVCRRTKQAACVDPADAATVVAAAHRLGATLTTVLTTHHHFDHAGGNNVMKKQIPGIAVVGGERDNVQGKTRSVADGEVIAIGDVSITCVHTPCHTNGHISYLARAAGTAALFTGDVLFVAGCGRFFEGGPDDMIATCEKLERLPPETLVYVGHEYTVKNLQFALAVEPENVHAQRKMVWAQERRAQGEATVPSTIGDERSFNPFLRCREPTVARFCGLGAASGDAAAVINVIRKLRNAKDCFAGSSRPWVPGGGPLPGL
jgi:hydroxyacylglutathione hydrolase